MATIQVQPRQTPAERAEDEVRIDIDEALAVHAAALEEWVDGHAGWDLQLREGHDFGRANNVEARLLFAAGSETCSLLFRLDQLDGADEAGDELVLRFEETDGIAKVARLTANGLDVELFHVLTYT